MLKNARFLRFLLAAVLCFISIGALAISVLGNTVVHSVEIFGGSNVHHNDRLQVGVLTNIANASAVAGTSVSTSAVFAQALPSASGYNAVVTPSQDVTAYVTGKTQAGFTVVLSPRLAASSVQVGTFDVLVTQ